MILRMNKLSQFLAFYVSVHAIVTNVVINLTLTLFIYGYKCQQVKNSHGFH